jgi:hypothetical protein
MLVESAHVTSLLEESILRFALHKRFSGVQKLRKM